MQVYVKQSKEALSQYERAFQIKAHQLHLNEDGSILHAELNIHGQVFALSEAYQDQNIGNTMQFCFQFHESDRDVIEHAYQVLKEHAHIDFPIGEVFYSKLMFSLVDQFGVSWCMFVTG